MFKKTQWAKMTCQYFVEEKQPHDYKKGSSICALNGAKKINLKFNKGWHLKFCYFCFLFSNKSSTYQETFLKKFPF